MTYGFAPAGRRVVGGGAGGFHDPGGRRQGGQHDHAPDVRFLHRGRQPRDLRRPLRPADFRREFRGAAAFRPARLDRLRRPLVREGRRLFGQRRSRRQAAPRRADVRRRRRRVRCETERRQGRQRRPARPRRRSGRRRRSLCRLRNQYQLQERQRPPRPPSPQLDAAGGRRRSHQARPMASSPRGVLRQGDRRFSRRRQRAGDPLHRRRGPDPVRQGRRTHLAFRRLVPPLRRRNRRQASRRLLRRRRRDGQGRGQRHVGRRPHRLGGPELHVGRKESFQLRALSKDRDAPRERHGRRRQPQPEPLGPVGP